MGSDQAILRLQERIVLLDWFRRDDIQSRSSNLAAVEGIGKILLYNKWPSTVVDKDYPILHFLDAFLVYDALGFREERAV